MSIEDRSRAAPPPNNAPRAETVEARRTGAPPPKGARRSALVHELRKRPRVFGAAALVVLIALFFLVKGIGGSPSKNLTLATVTRGDVESDITAVGSVQPKNYVDVGAQVSGQIKTLAVDVGDKVKKGQLLAEIDAQVQQARVNSDQDNLASLQAQLVDQQAQLNLKQLQYQREVRLAKAGANSQDDLQTAKAAFDSATAQVKALQAQIKQAQSTMQADQVTLGYANITAPMDGTVVSLSARLGQTINSVQQAPTILRIADLSLMEIITQVSEADVAKLKVGMPVYFTTLGNPARKYNSTLLQIEPTPETVNNVILYDVLFDVPNTDGSLMTQMTAQVFFVTASAKNVLMVPVEAVHPLTGQGGRRGAHKARGGQTGAPIAGANGGSGAAASAPQAPATGEAPAAQPGGTAGTPARAPAAPGAGAGGHAAFAANHGIVEVMGANGKIERRLVETGVSDRVNVEIKSGLKEGEKVIVGGAAPIHRPPSGGQQGGRPPGGGAVRMMGRI